MVTVQTYQSGAKIIIVTAPYIPAPHQITNFLRFCELVVKVGDAKTIRPISSYDAKDRKIESAGKFESIKESLKYHEVQSKYTFNENLHDREVRLDNGWVIEIGSGFDIYQKPDDWFSVGVNGLELHPCLETMVDAYRLA